jgi:hypothetical protein
MHDQIDLCLKFGFKELPQVDKIKKIHILAERNEDINITGFSFLTAGSGQFRFVAFDDIDYFPLAHNFTLEFTKNLVVPIVIHMSGNLFIFSVAHSRAWSVG